MIFQTPQDLTFESPLSIRFNYHDQRDHVYDKNGQELWVIDLVEAINALGPSTNTDVVKV